MPPYPLTNFEIRKYYQNEPRFNGFYSRDNLPDEYSDVITHWIALYCINIEIICFDTFEVEHVPKKIEKFIE